MSRLGGRLAWTLLVLAGCGDGSSRQERPAGRLEVGTPTPEYPLDGEGRVLCGADPACFVTQARACVASEVTHTQRVPKLAVVQTVVSRYRIVGAVGDRCRVTREPVALDVELVRDAVETLDSRGHGQDEVARRKARALAELRQANVPLECDMRRDQVSAMAGMLVTSEYDPRHWVECRRGAAATPEAPAAP